MQTPQPTVCRNSRIVTLNLHSEVVTIGASLTSDIGLAYAVGDQTKGANPMSTEDFITELFCRIDDAMQ